MTIPSRRDFLKPQIDVLSITSIFEKHVRIEDKARITCNHKLKLVQTHKKVDAEKCKVIFMHGWFSFPV